MGARGKKKWQKIDAGTNDHTFKQLVHGAPPLHKNSYSVFKFFKYYYHKNKRVQDKTVRVFTKSLRRGGDLLNRLIIFRDMILFFNLV